MRIGIGYDVHKLVFDRDLILGGVNIPYEKGLLGHSDADVLTHAVMDALLGAAALGDIGRHFPDNDNQYKGISSLKLLEIVHEKIKQENYDIVNIDCIIIAQQPKLATYIKDMEANLHKSINRCASERIINIKATTEEGLGFSGRGEGIAAKAVCLLTKTQV